MCTATKMMDAIPGQKRRRSSCTLSSSFEDESTTKTSAAVHEATFSSPQPKKQRYCMNEISRVLLSITPAEYAQAAFRANGHGNVGALQEKAVSLFQKPTPTMIESHQIDVVAAVRRNDLDAIRKMHQGGKLPGNACNKFGESILHIACHRGHTSMVKYMLEVMNVQVQTVRDDYHRTALHDACWTTEPAFDVVDLLLDAAPEHVLLKDARGFTPFDYVRKQDHGKWLRFLWERKHKLRPNNTGC
jgi:Ankyrin repeats (3 copies)